ncbi:hypothetical protein AMATHDRAFT_1400 [Amanita thiersii Skay4041]|uniref:Uncharacterized protein n=1 Tax=Amanita thiersii Skay4041 TaxID=703135 RepID=A0A2A9NY24_9AGAR|nr:hypothetical protein AMATHDRAFT_1400 [Amanita thiersii Skay4041]
MVQLSTFFVAALGAFQTFSTVFAGSATADDTVGDIINLLGLGIVERINVIITLNSLTTNLVSINFDAKNPLVTELTLDHVTSSAGVNNTEFAKFDHSFDPPFVIPPLKTKNSGQIDNVLLTQGVSASLALVPLGVLDLLSTDIHVRAATIDGFLGIPITITGLKQSNVPTKYAPRLFWLF